MTFMGSLVTKRKYYVNPRRLHYELVVSKAQGSLTRDAVKMIQLMIERVGTKFSYKYERDRVDCQGEATVVVFENWRKYDTSKESAFQYITEIIKRAYGFGWNVIDKGRDKELRMDVMFEDGQSGWGKL